MEKNRLLPLTKTIDGKELLCFLEKDIRKACQIHGCDPEMIEDCIENMREGQEDCTSCYITLINDVNSLPHFLSIKGQNETE
jgi:hypothetical protein